MRITSKEAAFLRAVIDSDGSASVREIRESTSLTWNQVSYYFDKLESRGLIDREWTDAPRNEPDGMRVAMIRDDVRDELIRDGSLQSAPVHMEMTDNELREEVREIARQAEKLTESLTDDLQVKTNRLYGLILRLEYEFESAMPDDYEFPTVGEALENDGQISDREAEYIIRAFDS